MIKVEYTGDAFGFDEVHRFVNTPVEKAGKLSWNIQQLWRESIKGIEWASKGVQSIGIDSWGVDYGLLDAQGNLLEDPVHYRDPRTEDVMDWVFERIDRREIFDRTGVQFLPLNTLYQLSSLVKGRKRILRNTGTYLGFPDLFHFWLTGEKKCEMTHASTTQLYNPVKKTWDDDIIEAVGLPIDVFPEIVQPGTMLGAMKTASVTTPASHDTGSAVVAVPTKTSDFCYISSGTWSLIGTETDSPVINDKTYDLNFTNEGGAADTVRLLKNLPGFWFQQELIREWTGKGEAVTNEDIQTIALTAEPFRSFIDPWDPSFMAPGDMTPRITRYCRDSGQPEPVSMSEHIRAVYDSLAIQYRRTLSQLEAVTGKTYDIIHVIGGGAQNEVMNQLTADATGRTVIAGPIEATAFGNAIVQLNGIGLIDDIWEARGLLAERLVQRFYHPSEEHDWGSADARYKEVIEK